MKSLALLAVLIFASSSLFAEENAATNLPPDPFGSIEASEKVPDYPVDVDRSRGSFTLDSADGQYQPGSHFANWFWKTEVERWGNYYVGLLYESTRPKLGIQVRVGDNILKGYAPRTNALMAREPMILGTAYLPEPGEYNVSMLTGDQSNVPAFTVKGVHFQPAPESKPLGQSIDGTITLDAKTATTYSEMMRYEPKEEKDCLGFWINPEDWAEWVFDVTTPGEFQISLVYGCGNGNEGSEIAVYLNDQTFGFTVEDTGGFQSWKEIDLGKIKLDIPGQNKLAIIPKTQAAKGIMDIQRVVLVPVTEYCEYEVRALWSKQHP
ncbi:MAG: hypothetical protein AAGF67_10175 [Verrucomicrobiota bacterium]